MVKSLTVQNYRKESAKIVLYEDCPSHGMIISQIEGLGPPKASINLSNFVTKDGGIFNSSRVEDRNLVLHLYLVDAPTIEDARLNVYKYFPIQKKCRILVETDRRKAQVYGYVESVEPEIFSDMESVQVSIICPESYWQSIEDGGSQITLFSGENPLFEFPFSNESLSNNLLELSESNKVTEGIVDYAGDVGCGVSMVLYVVDSLSTVGSPSSVTITNHTTKDTMTLNLNGLTLQQDDEIRIDTTFGNKSIILYRDGTTTNLLNRLGSTSEWLRITRGENLISYSVGTEQQQRAFDLTISNSVWYEGM